MYVATCNSCNMGERDLPDMYARSLRAAGPRAYISGESRAPMLQVICITSGTLKICPNLQAFALPIYITTRIRFDYDIFTRRFDDVYLFNAL